MPYYQLAHGGHIQGSTITTNIVHCLCFRDMFAFLSYYHSKFDFFINCSETFRNLSVYVQFHNENLHVCATYHNFLPFSNIGCSRFKENTRYFRLCLIFSLQKRAIKLIFGFHIKQNTVDILTGNWLQYLCTFYQIVQNFLWHS